MQRNSTYSKGFLRINQIALIFTLLVVVAGSVVRTSGSGMGCPDWPKCFGQVIPPTDKSQLPEDYLETFLEKRSKKAQRFAGFLDKIGLDETAKRILTDPTVYEEEPFNARKTWIEYINRLFGVLAGLAIAIVFFWSLFRYRRNGILLLAFVNSVVLLFQAWFGSIVVATNLVPWTITLHMLLAVLMLMLEIRILYKLRVFPNVTIPKKIKVLARAVFVICFVQMILGAQVRQEFDQFYLDGVEKVGWLDLVSIKFVIHRSFSWIVLVLILWLFWLNRKANLGLRQVQFLTILLILELVSGVVLAYVDVPAIAQTIHLVLACLLFISAFFLAQRVGYKERMGI